MIFSWIFSSHQFIKLINLATYQLSNVSIEQRIILENSCFKENMVDEFFHRSRKHLDCFETLNPASGQPLASITEAGEIDIDQAVNAAGKAFNSWSTLDRHRRSRYLYAMARQMQKHSRLLAVLETLDNG